MNINFQERVRVDTHVGMITEAGVAAFVTSPITVTTLLRICAVFKTPMARLVRGIDKGFYDG